MAELRPIPNFRKDWYAAGDDGLIYSRRRCGRHPGIAEHWRPLKSFLLKKKPAVRIQQDDGRIVNVPVDRCVCRAFHGPRPLGCVPYHYPDRDDGNCRADNLRWAPYGTAHLGNRNNPRSAENLKKSTRQQRRFTPEQVAWARAAYGQGQSIYALAEELGRHPAIVAWMVTGKTYADLPGAVVRPRNTARGSSTGSAKLDELMVEEIRAGHASGKTGAQMARELGMSRSAVNKVVSGASWGHVLPTGDH